MEYDLTSLAGIMGLTALIVSQLKVWLGTTPYVKHMPVILVSILVAFGLTLLAVQAGYQTGPLHILIAKAILMALGSAGLYDIKTGSSLQSLLESAVHPTTLGNNSVQVGEVRVLEKNELPPPNAVKLGLFISMCGLLTMTMSCSVIQKWQQNYEQSTPLGKVATAKEVYTQLLTTIKTYRDLGYISQAQINKTAPADRVCRIALDEWERLATSGADTSTEEAKFAEALKVIQALITSATTRPSTQPTTYEWIERTIPYDVSSNSGRSNRIAPVGGYTGA